MAIFLGVTSLLLALVVILLIQRLHRINAIVASISATLDEAQEREIVTNLRVSNILITMTPLLEQTDWMTGRWGGQFQTLVSMENRRNTAARNIRTKLFELPAIKDYTSGNMLDILTASSTVALREMTK